MLGAKTDNSGAEARAEQATAAATAAVARNGSLDEIASVTWDAIVIGTGMGGGTTGRALAEAGLKVLFLEKGSAGRRTERHSMSSSLSDPVARTIRGAWPAPMVGQIDGREVTFFGPIGAGVGGSSVFYAATLERPERHDLETTDGRPHPAGGWPIGYDAFRPWLEKAEALFDVAGGPDPLGLEPPFPLRPAPALKTAEIALMDSFRRAGLHPYRQHVAVRAIDGCLNCLGSKCPHPCKMDGRSAGVEPALATGRAALLADCAVTRICGGSGRVTHLEANRGGETVTLKARAYVLAAGAFGSPRLLLASAAAAWPQGCANESGLVGRNLMFHLNEMLAIWPPAAKRPHAPSRALALRDLYFSDGDRFGMIQTMGISVGYGLIVSYLDALLARRGLSRINLLARPTAAVAARMLGEAQLFSCLLEDFADPENRVLPADGDSDRLGFVYRLSEEIIARRRRYRRRLMRALPGRRKLFLNRSPEPNFGHGCGTLKFGQDPATSVLDPSCRTHSLANLWVADASFMPSSTGVNPGLTIAANALRVAAAVVEARR